MERDETVQQLSFTAEHFNSHAHVERDGVVKGYEIILLNFNSHAHVERDTLSS